LPGDNSFDNRRIPLVGVDDTLLDLLCALFKQLCERLLVELSRQITDSGERGRIDLIEERFLGV
jgi:hypothetical protein